MKDCLKGEIKIKSYKTKRGRTVKAHCRKDTGKPGKGKRLFTLKKGDLSRYGYSLKSTEQERKKALDKAVNKYSKNTMIKKLNVLRVLHKNTNPKYASRAYTDMKYIQSK
jgi:hypothetical protein